MALSNDLVLAVDSAVDALMDEATALARAIHARPELRFEEHFAAEAISTMLGRHGVACQRGVAGLPTALRADVGQGPSPCVAILAEYDALPEIGHACGHNLIAAAGVTAFLAAAPLAERAGGALRFLGTPAEEGGGGKVTMLEAGCFEGLDAAMMVHPFDRDLLVHTTLACLWVDCTFRGAPAHAAIAPHDGASALTACMDAFRLVDGQRVHFRDGVRVHGIITDGGQAVNVIPERASCQFLVRATSHDELERVRSIVERCARGAAMASAVSVDVVLTRGYREMRNNHALASAFGGHLASGGRHARSADPTVGAGSTDMGDVSQAVPSIHPWLAICGEGVTTCHERAFAEAAVSDAAMKAISDGARAMAKLSLEVLADEELRGAVQAEQRAAR